MRNEILALAILAGPVLGLWGWYLFYLAVARLRYEYRRKYA